VLVLVAVTALSVMIVNDRQSHGKLLGDFSHFVSHYYCVGYDYDYSSLLVSRKTLNCTGFDTHIQNDIGFLVTFVYTLYSVSQAFML